ncbi:MAG: hypothetical protein AAGB19_13590 [Cyanobacteria bacterium P01_F01_bin.3]
MMARQFSINHFSLKENSDRRIIAAIRCMDAVTGSALRQQIEIKAPGVRFIRNLSGQIVLTQAPGFERYREQFHLDSLSNPPTPQPIRLSLNDPSGHYLPREFTFNLPRNPATDEASLSSPTSLFSPVDIPLYPSGLHPTNPGWAVLRGTVLNSATGERLPWALIRIAVNGQQHLAQADHRGEVMAVAPGLPVTTWSVDNGNPDNPAPVTTQEFDATLTVFFDPVAVTPLAADTDFSNSPDNSFGPGENYRPDPDDLNSDRTGLLSGSLTLSLSSGSERAQPLRFSLTPT